MKVVSADVVLVAVATEDVMAVVLVAKEEAVVATEEATAVAADVKVVIAMVVVSGISLAVAVKIEEDAKAVANADVAHNSMIKIKRF
ncbi:hypothetical protein D9M68_788780 [compost metagenome]